MIDQVSEEDLIWAYNMNAYLDEAIKSMTIPPKAREAGNPFEPQTANWYRWEQGMKEYEEAKAEQWIRRLEKKLDDGEFAT